MEDSLNGSDDDNSHHETGLLRVPSPFCLLILSLLHVCLIVIPAASPECECVLVQATTSKWWCACVRLCHASSTETNASRILHESKMNAASRYRKICLHSMIRGRTKPQLRFSSFFFIFCCCCKETLWVNQIWSCTLMNINICFFFYTHTQGNFSSYTFTFDHVYSENSNQSDVYNNTARDAVLSSLSGYNASIIAYGQTGTGKTYTMEGEPSPKLRGTHTNARQRTHTHPVQRTQLTKTHALVLTRHSSLSRHHPPSDRGNIRIY